MGVKFYMPLESLNIQEFNLFYFETGYKEKKGVNVTI